MPYTIVLTPLFEHLEVELDNEVYIHVGDSDKISKNFVLKTKRVKMEKKQVESSKESSERNSFVKSASD